VCPSANFSLDAQHSEGIEVLAVMFNVPDTTFYTNVMRHNSHLVKKICGTQATNRDLKSAQEGCVLQILAPALGLGNKDILGNILGFLGAKYNELFDPEIKLKVKVPKGFVWKHSTASLKRAIGDVCQPSGGAADSRSKHSRVCLPPKMVVNQDLKFRENVENVKKFVQKYKELPRRRGERKNEAVLAIFIHNNPQRKLSGERLKLLKAVPHMKEHLQHDPETRFSEQVKSLQAFVKKFDELPTRNGERKNEAVLAMFIKLHLQWKPSAERLKLLKAVPHMKERLKKWHARSG